MVEFTFKSLPDGGVLSYASNFFMKIGGGTLCIHRDLEVFGDDDWPEEPLPRAYLPNLRIIPPQLLL